jgi:potassium-transporting ATPase KdpC subunit
MKNLLTATLMTITTTVLLGLVYPLAVTGIAQLVFHDQANGQLITRSDGVIIGSKIIGQPFNGPGYFHSRPSAAGIAGYDAGASSGSNLGPTSQKLINRVTTDVAVMQTQLPGNAVPIDLVTASASGLDPHISPAAARFQVARVSKERALTEDEVKALITKNTEGRTFGILGEPRVNVLLLNLALDERRPMSK